MRTELYAEALVEQLRGFKSVGLVERAKEVEAELERIAEDVPRAIAKAEADIKGSIKLETGTDPAVLDNISEVRRLRQLEQDLIELGHYGSKRTAKAASAPNKTTA